MFHKLLVAYDGSPEARRALEAGIDMARCFGTGLAAVTVEEEMPPYLVMPASPYTAAVSPYGGFMAPEIVTEIEEQRDAYYTQLQEEAKALAAEKGVALETAVVAGDEVGAVVEHVQAMKADLLLVGCRPHSALHDRLLGSTAHGLALAAPCSVLTVK